jgi:hypothetical protein
MICFVLCHDPMFSLSLECPFLFAFQFSLLFIYKYIFYIIPYNYWWHILVWLSYTFVQIISNDTYKYFKFVRLLKVLSSITIMLLWSNHLSIYNTYISFIFLLKYWLSNISYTMLIINWVSVSVDRAQITLLERSCTQVLVKVIRSCLLLDTLHYTHI